MKPIVLLALLALALPAAAQPAKPAPEKAAAEKPAAAKAAAKPAVASAEGRKSRRGEDARHCLEKSSNTEIIKCAEAYL